MENVFSCTGYIKPNTVISNAFIEHFMLDANGSYVKVYLYLSEYIQAGKTDISVSELADKMDSTERDIIRALQHWEKKGLICITVDNEDNLISIDMYNPDDVYESIKKDTQTDEVIDDIASTEQMPFSGTKETENRFLNSKPVTVSPKQLNGHVRLSNRFLKDRSSQMR